MPTLRSCLVLLLVLTPGSGITLGQAPRDTAPPLVVESLAGRDSFERYCAACHGANGKGDGPVTGALRSQPSDLTTLARRNGGTFPRGEIVRFVEGAGRATPAHGTGDMPVWGPIFRGLETSEVRVKVRIENLVAYVESLQEPAEPTPAPVPAAVTGAQLFRSYCASCHGADARGAGPVTEVLREVPPDLTEYALLNGGVFPSVRVAQIIDGRHVAAHGDTEMPVWGRVFMRERDGDEASVRARINALVSYLESIQQRRAE